MFGCCAAGKVLTCRREWLQSASRVRNGRRWSTSQQMIQILPLHLPLPSCPFSFPSPPAPLLSPPFPPPLLPFPLTFPFPPSIPHSFSPSPSFFFHLCVYIAPGVRLTRASLLEQLSGTCAIGSAFRTTRSFRLCWTTGRRPQNNRANLARKRSPSCERRWRCVDFHWRWRLRGPT